MLSPNLFWTYSAMFWRSNPYILTWESLHTRVWSSNPGPGVNDCRGESCRFIPGDRHDIFHLKHFFRPELYLLSRLTHKMQYIRNFLDNTLYSSEEFEAHQEGSFRLSSRRTRGRWSLLQYNFFLVTCEVCRISRSDILSRPFYNSSTNWILWWMFTDKVVWS